MIGGGLSIAASELSLSTGGGNGLLTMGIPVSTKIQHHKIKPFKLGNRYRLNIPIW